MKEEGADELLTNCKQLKLKADDARKAIEAGTGKPIITNKKAAELNHVVTEMIEASAGAVEKGKVEKNNEV